MNQLIGITMGCPVGIGPEIILRFFSDNSPGSNFTPIVLGDIGVLERTASLLGMPAAIIAWEPDTVVEPGTVPVYSLSSLEAGSLHWGQPDEKTGKAMACFIEEAVRLIRNKTLVGMVTCPITKTALNRAGYMYPGHTEMLADLTGTDNYLMMMAGRQLKVSLVTIHEPLGRVATLLSSDKIMNCIRLTGMSLRRDFGINTPRIGVAGLNPHGGEQGMFGCEEQDVIAPAIRACSDVGEISGPWSPDTVFHHAVAGRFDAVVAMYHDQGLIPFKLLHFSDGVNVTLGLPVVRTSVDHGTAYDIAGKGLADSSSLKAAYDLATEIVMNREREDKSKIGMHQIMGGEDEVHGSGAGEN